MNLPTQDALNKFSIPKVSQLKPDLEWESRLERQLGLILLKYWLILSPSWSSSRLRAGTLCYHRQRKSAPSTSSSTFRFRYFLSPLLTQPREPLQSGSKNIFQFFCRDFSPNNGTCKTMKNIFYKILVHAKLSNTENIIFLYNYVLVTNADVSTYMN